MEAKQILSRLSSLFTSLDAWSSYCVTVMHLSCLIGQILAINVIDAFKKCPYKLFIFCSRVNVLDKIKNCASKTAL